MVRSYCDICQKELPKGGVNIATDLDFDKVSNFKANKIFNHMSNVICWECYNQLQSWYSDGLNKFKSAKQVLLK